MFDYIEDPALKAKAEEEYNASIVTINGGVQKKIDEAVSGLKTKNDEILGEKKKLQDMLDKFKDIKDPVKALEALQLLDQNEYAQLIKDGKFEEVLEKRVSTATSRLTAVIDELNGKLEVSNKEGSTYKSKYQTKVIEDDIRAAAIKAGVRPEALADVLMRGINVFSLSEDGQVEARDKQGNLIKNKDKLIMTPDVWVDSLKESAPHYWPDSEGAGLTGNNLLAESDFNKKADALLAKGDYNGYRKLRAKQKAA